MLIAVFHGRQESARSSHSLVSIKAGVFTGPFVHTAMAPRVEVLATDPRTLRSSK